MFGEVMLKVGQRRLRAGHHHLDDTGQFTANLPKERLLGSHAAARRMGVMRLCPDSADLNQLRVELHNLCATLPDADHGVG